LSPQSPGDVAAEKAEEKKRRRMWKSKEEKRKINKNLGSRSLVIFFFFNGLLAIRALRPRLVCGIDPWNWMTIPME
jgi:hypothetical protein